jgi:hypothetical protein
MANNYMVSNKKQIGLNYGISDVLFYTDKKWIVLAKTIIIRGICSVEHFHERPRAFGSSKMASCQIVVVEAAFNRLNT